MLGMSMSECGSRTTVFVPASIAELVNAVVSGDAGACSALLSPEFVCAPSEHHSMAPLTKHLLTSAARLSHQVLENIAVTATASCKYANSALEPLLRGKDAQFFIVQMEEKDGGGRMGPPAIGLYVAILNLDGQCRYMERFRPLMGREADTLLRDPAAYRDRMAQLPRLNVRHARGSQDHMCGVAAALSRALFGPEAYSGNAFDLLTDDVVFFDGNADPLPGPLSRVQPPMAGLEGLRLLAEDVSIGMQMLMAVAASEDSNTAFVHLALMTMGEMSEGWKPKAWRGIVCYAFDDACNKVEAICLMRTYIAYERETLYVPNATLGR